MCSLQVIQLEDSNHSPFIFPVVFPFDQSFILSHQSPKSHRFHPQSPEIPLSFMLSLALVLGHPRKSPCFWPPPPPPFSSSSTYLFTEPNSPEWLPSYTRLSPGISWRQCPVLFLCSIHTHHVLMFSVW
ncbi:hypothetical protein CY34DRAFT_749130 [Suillus luteus UH-Slu-Lm8-n1]|uniref:Uncharacterized protein n=1 Tax=Suillus luteus UH-Slu-Lm8-n1 TaxID=930992 RepID=A0A0D0AYL0_9AGAM|nr:hypothetical protein CY34DRAFT_749130 [Suillus luteus UH-Slu-Lm8-n1]